MLSFRQSIAIFVSLVAITGTEMPVGASKLSSPTVRAIANSRRSLNTFTVLDPASAPTYFLDPPTNPWLPPAPTVATYPTATSPGATGDAATQKPSSQLPEEVSSSPTLRPLEAAKDAALSSVQPSPSTAKYYPSISPLSDVLSTLPYSLQTLSPSATKKSPTIITSGETIPPTSSQSKRLSNENIDSSRTRLPGVEQPQEGDDADDQKPSLYFETSIPGIQIHIEYSSAERRDENDLLRDKLRAFFLELLASSPNSASFVTADLLVVVTSSFPLEVLVTGKVLYGQNDLPTTKDITAQLRTYFSYWGTGHLNEYLGSDRVSIQLNGVPVSPQGDEEEPSDSPALSIILSTILIMIAIAMFAFGVFAYRLVRQRTALPEKQEATRPNESKENTYPKIVMTPSGSLESLSNHEDADTDRKSVAPSLKCKSRPYSEEDEASKTSEEDYGPCSL